MLIPKIRPRERDSIIQALRAGVVPRQGLRHIQVGRAREIEELAHDMDRIVAGGGAIRFIIGEYGAGKTFFLNLVRLIALEKGLVTLSADLAPDRRLHSSGGQARSLYAELTRNAATRSKPDGGALPSIVERFIGQAVQAAEAEGREPGVAIREKLAHLQEHVGGYDFAAVIARYWEGSETGNEALCASALRWLRAEFSTRTDARQALGVRTIINDANFYDQLKLLALFVREAGYQGMVVGLDEMVNLYKLTSSQARNSNYEQILRIFNDILQGTTSHLGFVFGGTPEFLLDTRRGLYSYDALKSRLAANTFARDGLVDLSGPVIGLTNLTPEDVYVLLSNIRGVLQEPGQAVPDEALTAFMTHCSKRVGDAYFRTPRNTVTAFVNMLAVLEQNPEVGWPALVGSLQVAIDQGPAGDAAGDKVLAVAGGMADDELQSFKL